MKTGGDPRRSLGRRGEGWAALYLRLQGYRILNRNLRTPLGEIDLVARRGRAIVVVEVKSRKGGAAAFEEETHLRRAQEDRLRRAARWIADRVAGRGGWGVRVDVVTVRFPSGRWGLPRIRHSIDALRDDAR